MDFNFEQKTYPNGSNYFELRVGKHIVGSAITVVDGFLVQGKRKPVKTLQSAAKQCLDDSMNACVKKHTELQRLMQRLLRET